MQDWQRTARFLWFVQFLTTLAMNLGLTFVPFILRDDPVLAIADESTRIIYVSLILGAPFVTTILFTPLWGWVADRMGPRQQVIRACLGLGLTQLLMAVAQSADQMVWIRIFQGMVAGVLSACLGLVTTTTPPSHLGRAISLIQSATPAGQILGPLLGGILAMTVGFRATYTLMGVSILATAAMTFLFLPRQVHVATSITNPFAGLYQAMKQTLRTPELQGAFSLLTSAQFAFTVTQGVFAIYAAKIFAQSISIPEAERSWWNTDVGFVSLALAITALSNAICSRWWGRLHDLGFTHLTETGAMLLALAMLLLIVWPQWWAILLSRLGVGIGLGALATIPYAVISTHVPREHRGQMMGLATASSQVGNLFGFLLSGVISAAWSERSNFILATTIYCLIVLWKLTRSVRFATSETTPITTSEISG